MHKQSKSCLIGLPSLLQGKNRRQTNHQKKQEQPVVYYINQTGLNLQQVAKNKM